jgi:4,5:9,10-diseco-3-hydroxy-5,9,17-trioxoandrosta-1(10),2-diene-4-oate hydrolase
MAWREQVGVPEESVLIEVNGVQLAVAREGRGPAVVCLHAIGHGGRDFEAFANAMRDRFEVVRIDWPGQGRSGPDAAPPSAARYAQLLAGVLERLQIRSPILIGNSIGGATALLYAQQHPVRALVLCDSGGLVKVNAMVRLFCRFFTWFFGAGARGARWFDAAFRFYYRFIVLPGRAASVQRERIIRSGYETASLLQGAWAGFGRQDADIRRIAEALEVPVWFAWARSDRVIPLSFCMPCIRRMQRATVTKFKGGHSAFLEQPDAFIRGFADFVSSLDRHTELPHAQALRV